MKAAATKLLVSVRDAAEAGIALEAGADIIDVKEPARGSLGRADDGTIAAVARTVGDRRLVTAALGELLARPSPPGEFDGWLKVGLEGCGEGIDWPARLRMLIGDVAPRRMVAVAYADSAGARSPLPAQVLHFAAEHGCPALLVDTWAKDGPTLLDWLPLSVLRDWCGLCREAGTQLALAGALGEAQITQILPLKPDIIAVRGAACRGGARGATVDGAAVARLAELVHGRSRKLMSTISVDRSARASFGNHLSTIPSAANSSQV